MNTIHLTDEQLKLFRQSFIEQLEEAKKKVAELQAIINKIDGVGDSPRNPTIKKSDKQKEKKLTNSDFVHFVKKVFEENKKALTANEITLMGMEYFPGHKKEEIRLGIARVLTNNVKINKSMKSYLPEGKTRGAYFGPKSWFDGDKIKKEYIG